MFNNKLKMDSVSEEIKKIIDESWDDDEDDDVKRADAELRRMKAKPIEADKKTDADKEIGKLAKKTPKEMDEELKGSQHKLDVAKPKGKLTAADFKKLRKEDAEQIDELSYKTLKSYIGKAAKSSSDLTGKQIDQHNKGLTADPKIRHKQINRSVGIKNAENKLDMREQIVSEKTLTPAESKKKEEIVKSMKKKKKDLKARYGKRWKEVAFATATKSAKRVAEEIVKEANLFDKYKSRKRLKDAKDFEQDWQKDLKKGGLKDPTSEKKVRRIDQKLKKEDVVNEAQGPTSTYSSDDFTPPANTTSSPMSLSKDLATNALKKIRSNLRGGEQSSTLEEIDPSVKTTDMLKGRFKGGKKDDVGPGSDFKSTKVKYTPGPK